MDERQQSGSDRREGAKWGCIGGRKERRIHLAGAVVVGTQNSSTAVWATVGGVDMGGLVSRKVRGDTLREARADCNQQGEAGSRQLEDGLLDLGGPSPGKAHVRTDRAEARLLKDA